MKVITLSSHISFFVLYHYLPIGLYNFLRFLFFVCKNRTILDLYLLHEIYSTSYSYFLFLISVLHVFFLKINVTLEILKFEVDCDNLNFL